MPGELWHIQMLGGLRVTRGNRVIERFRTRKAASLLAWLAYRPQQAVARDTILAEFWPDSNTEAARNSLRQTLHLLRELLEPEGNALPLVLSGRTALQLNSATFETDVARFDALLKAAKASETTEEGLRHAMQAVELYAGELLAGYYDEWIFPERQRLEAAYVQTLHEIVRGLEAANEPLRAVEYALRLVAADPLEEAAHCQAIRLYAASGQTTRASAQYRELERLLREEFGDEPSLATRESVGVMLGSERITAPLRTPSASVQVAQVSLPSLPALPQLIAPALEEQTPASVVPARPTPLTRFFGREAEIEELARRLCDPHTRLVTLTGTGGTGKTRLSIEVLHQVAAEYDNAVYFVPLASLPDARLVPDAIADALALPRRINQPLQEQIVRHLSQRRTLLLLDNFETVAEKGAACVLSLLQQVACLTCFVTSRQSLHIEGEEEFAVAPLPVPDRRAGLCSTEEAASLPSRLWEFACVQLFLDRARAVRPGFQVTPHNAPDLAAVCAQLEGVPLAIELAAARIGALSLSQMREQLQHRLDFLVSRRSDLPARHRSVRAAIEWSYRIAPPQLQRGFHCLAVFAGGFTLEGAEAVIREEGSETPNAQRPTPNALDLLEQLRERSLIQAEETEAGLRFTMLETLREFGRERWTSEEAQEISERHARYIAEVYHLPWYTQESRDRLPMLCAELDNLRLALEWLIPRDVEAAAQTALGAYGVFCHVRKFPEERAWLERILATEPEGALLLRTEADLYNVLACGVGGDQRDTASAHAYGLKCLTILEQLNDLPDQCSFIRNMIVIAKIGGDFDTALAHGAHYRHLAQLLGDKAKLANASYEIGSVLLGMRRLDEAEAHFRESLQQSRALNRRGGNALKDLGYIAFVRGDYTQAVALFREALDGVEDPSAWWLIAYGCTLPFTDEAEALERGCEAIRQGLNQNLADQADYDVPFFTIPFVHIARLAQEVLGDSELAARLLGAHVREQHGKYDVPLSVFDTAEVDHCAAAAEAVLGIERFASAYTSGRGTPWRETAHLILRRLPAS